MKNKHATEFVSIVSLVAFMGLGNGQSAVPAAFAPGRPTVFTAKKILTMEPALPEATAVAVANGRIVSVGSLGSLQDWIAEHAAVVDDRFADRVMMPGFIDPHIHPSLPAVLTQFPFIAPDDWSLPTGEFPGATTPEAYVKRLQELVALHDDPSIPFIAWGYHPLWHGDQYRPQLNELFPDKPVMLWHRSFHEMIGNDAAFALLGITEADFEGQEQLDWDRGHAWENGLMSLLPKLPFLFASDRYGKGMENLIAMMTRSGVTTAMDQGTGIFGDPSGEIATVRRLLESTRAPVRLVMMPLITDFLARGRTPEQALKEIEGWRSENSHRVLVQSHFKIMMDGAIFSGLSQMGPPGYLDGHEGIWMAPLETTTEWARFFWNRGYQIHAHTNGDKSAAAFIELLRTLQDEKPRFDHRATLEHFAYSTEDQSRQLAALGAIVSANPYYPYILADVYSERWLGEDRGRQMVRLGSLERLGVSFSLHSDNTMAPLDPLLLAWCATNRVTINGNLNAPQERISLDAALRAITTEAAWMMGWEDEIGSIRAGKRADFAILNADPYEVGAEGLRDIEVWGTVFEGDVAPAKKTGAGQTR